MNRILSTFRSLKYKNFRLFFPGLIASQIGLWIQNIAMGWLVYNMTKSPFMMGTIMFFNAIPLFFVTPFAGVIIDKFSRHKLLIIIQILFAVQSLLLAILTLSGLIRIWNIILLGIMLNAIAAIDIPLRQSMFVFLVDDKKDLGNAISLNSTCFNLARLAGPAIGGILIAATGEGMCFLINFLCFLPSVILVSFMKINEQKSEHVKEETLLEGLKEGIEYVKSDIRIILILIFLSLFCFLGMTYPMLMPIYTKDVFNANADTLGFLMAAAGIGALISSLLIASKNTIRGLKYIECIGGIVFSISFILLGFSNNIKLSIIFMFFLGLGMTACITSVNTLIQSIIDNEKRGRVMSIHAICYLGTTSISSFCAGTVAEHIGIKNTLIILGLILLAASLYFLYRFSKLQFNK
ncbi:MFS transporter [bacterium]|nr:MFS transporter [bacterium]